MSDKRFTTLVNNASKPDSKTPGITVGPAKLPNDHTIYFGKRAREKKNAETDLPSAHKGDKNKAGSMRNHQITCR